MHFLGLLLLTVAKVLRLLIALDTILVGMIFEYSARLLTGP